MDKNLPTFSSVGTVIYDPPRGAMKNRTDWWCVIEADKEITRYYRWWIRQRFWAGTALDPDWLCSPSWDAHISIVRGERPRTPEARALWKKYNGEKVEFKYAHYPIQGWKDYIWQIDVWCPEINYIRWELGLPTYDTYHLTVGRTWENRSKK